MHDPELVKRSPVDCLEWILHILIVGLKNQKVVEFRKSKGI